MRRSLVLIIFVILFAFVGMAVVSSNTKPPQINYFDEWLFLFPDNTVTTLPSVCRSATYETYYNYLEQYYYCPNVAESLNSIYVHIQDGVIEYISFRPNDLRYGDLVAAFGQPTLVNLVRGKITSIYFGEIYVIITDRTYPIDYETLVRTIGFTTNPIRRNR